MNGSPKNGKNRKIRCLGAVGLTSPEEERSAWKTAFIIMLFFSALGLSLEILNFLRLTKFPLFTVEFLLSIVYVPTGVLAVGWAFSRRRPAMTSSSS